VQTKKAYLLKNIIAGERNGRRPMTQTGSSGGVRNGSINAVNDSGSNGNG
jgi:hypothetical protein